MNLIDQLKQIPDLRGTRGKRYPLWQLLLLALLGSLCGYVGYRPLSAFCTENRVELEAVLALPEGVPTPAYSTFRRLFMAVKYTDIAKLFDAWCHAFMRPPPRCGLAEMAKVFDVPVAMMGVITLLPSVYIAIPLVVSLL